MSLSNIARVLEGKGYTDISSQICYILQKHLATEVIF